MNPLAAVTGTIYFWFFLGAVFLAAALNSIVSALLEHLKKVSSWSRHLPAFYFFLSLSIAFVSLSVFFVDWKKVHISQTLFLFVLVAIVLFVFIFRFFLFFGVGFILFFAGSVFFLNTLLAGWQNMNTHAQILALRLLNKNTTEYVYEISVPGKTDTFYKSEGGRGQITLYLVHPAPWLFFVPGKNYVFVDGNTGSWKFRMLRKISGVYGPFSMKKIVYSLPEIQLLWRYRLKLIGDKVEIGMDL